MNNTTYLLGAGASAQTLPVVRAFGDAIAAFKSAVSAHNAFNSPFYNNQSIDGIKEKLMQDLEWLWNQNRRSFSIDTLARSFHLQGDEDKYLKVKLLVSLVLQYQQFCNGNDRRYNNLMARILKGDRRTGLTLPYNTKFLSWNYDIQFELAFRDLTGRSLYESDLLQNYQNCSAETCEIEKPAFIKLNGSINYYTSTNGGAAFREYPRELEKWAYEGVTDDKDRDKVVRELLIQYYELGDFRGRYFNGLIILHYAWENDSYAINVRELAKFAVSGTNDLVVIGYSFPEFNNEIDADLLSNMKYLERVIIQDMNPKTAARNLRAMWDGKIEEETDVDFFVRPL